jgi:hypothetical protein
MHPVRARTRLMKRATDVKPLDMGRLLLIDHLPDRGMYAPARNGSQKLVQFNPQLCE